MSRGATVASAPQFIVPAMQWHRSWSTPCTNDDVCLWCVCWVARSWWFLARSADGRWLEVGGSSCVQLTVHLARRQHRAVGAAQEVFTDWALRNKQSHQTACTHHGACTRHDACIQCDCVWNHDTYTRHDACIHRCNVRRLKRSLQPPKTVV